MTCSDLLIQKSVTKITSFFLFLLKSSHDCFLNLSTELISQLLHFSTIIYLQLLFRLSSLLLFFIMNSDLDILSSPTLSQSASQTRVSDFQSDCEILQVEVQCEVPSALEQLNCKSKYYIIWNANEVEIFSSWWNQLPAVKKCQKSGSGKSHSCWANAHRTSTFWQEFHQAAEKRTGDPDIICKKCHIVLAHSTYSRNGCSGMKKHLESHDCTLNAIANHANQNISLLLISWFS